MEEERPVAEACVNLLINNLTDLKKVLSMCRKQGVKDIKLGDISIAFGDDLRKQLNDLDEDDADVPIDGMSPDDLAFYSSGGPIK